MRSGDCSNSICLDPETVWCLDYDSDPGLPNRRGPDPTDDHDSDRARSAGTGVQTPAGRRDLITSAPQDCRVNVT